MVLNKGGSIHQSPNYCFHRYKKSDSYIVLMYFTTITCFIVLRG